MDTITWVHRELLIYEEEAERIAAAVDRMVAAGLSESEARKLVSEIYWVAHSEGGASARFD